MDASNKETYDRMNSSGSENGNTSVQAQDNKKRCKVQRAKELGRKAVASSQHQVQTFRRNHGSKVSKCMRFPWLTVALVIATIFLAVKMGCPAGKIQKELRSLVTEHKHRIKVKGPIVRGFIGLGLVNFGVLVMSFMASDLCKCPHKKRRCAGTSANGEQPCRGKRFCRAICKHKQCIKWALHWVFLLAAYTLAVCALVSVVGAAVAVVLTAASDGICNSGLTDLTSIVNTVLAAFREWICSMQNKHHNSDSSDSFSSSSDDSYDWGRHHHHKNFCEKIPMSFTEQQVNDWCAAADDMWKPGMKLVWAGLALVVVQFTVAMVQRANLVAFKKKMQAQCKKACGVSEGTGVEISDVPAVTPGGDECANTIAV